MENLDLTKMTYKEFKDWCNRRAEDGNWSLLTAMACLSVIQEMESIKVKGLFKRKATEQAREEAWRKRNYTTLF